MTRSKVYAKSTVSWLDWPSHPSFFRRGVTRSARIFSLMGGLRLASVLFALSSRADPAEIGFSMKKPCAVRMRLVKKTLADVVRRPQMRYQHSGFSQKNRGFRLLVTQ